MIIESQDKMEIFNFDEIFRLYVDNWSNEEFATEPNCFCIKAEKSSDNMICAFLGAGMGNYLRCKLSEHHFTLFLCIVSSITLACLVYAGILKFAEKNKVYRMPKE